MYHILKWLALIQLRKMDYSRQFLFLMLLMLFCQRQTDLLFVYSLDITFQMERMRREAIQKSLRYIFVCTKSIDISLCLWYGIRYRLFASESRLNASIHTTKFMAKNRHIINFQQMRIKKMFAMKSEEFHL